MKLKHKVLQDFQFLTSDKKIVILKAGTIIEEYKLITKSDKINIEKDIIDQNPQFFLPLDWKAELLSYLKSNKIPQPSPLSKKLFPFIEEMFIIGNQNSISIDPEYKIGEVNQKELKLSAFEKDLIIKENKLKEELESIDHIKEEYKYKFEKLNSKELELENIKEKVVESPTENTNIDHIKKMVIDMHASLPYYQNKMDMLKKKIEEIISELEKI